MTWSFVEFISRDLAVLTIGLGVTVTGLFDRSSPWISLTVMEISVLLFFFLDGYLRWKQGEDVGQVGRGTAIGLLIGIPLMAISLFLGGLLFEWLDAIVSSSKAS